MNSRSVRNSLAVPLVAFCATLALGAGLLVSSSSYAAEKISVAVGKPVAAAQEAMKKKDWAAALEQIKTAQALPNKKPNEIYTIDALLAYVLFQQQKLADVAVVYERMINSGLMPAAEIDDRTKALAQIDWQLRKYPETIKWLKIYVAKRPTDQDAMQLLAQTYFQTADYKNAAATANALIASSSGKPPKESWLRIAYNSSEQLGNRAGGADALKMLVRTYQQPEDWASMFRVVAGKSYGDRISLSLNRLKLDTGVLKHSEDYVEMVQLALDAGVANEAQQIIERGTKNGVLKVAEKTQQSKFDRLSATAQSQSTAMRAALPKLSTDASSAANGESYVKLGQIYTSDGKYDQAIEALQSGIRKGGLPDADEAQVNLGIAYLKKGQKDQARTTFKTVKKDSKWADLAELWSLRAS